MNKRVLISAIIGAVAVMLGAFGAHVLKPHLSDVQIDTFRTASLYHLVHTVVLLVIAFQSKNSKVLSLSFLLFSLGIALFSGSLYILSTKDLIGGDMWNFLGPVTPLGGILLISAWLNLARYSPDKENS